VGVDGETTFKCNPSLDWIYEHALADFHIGVIPLGSPIVPSPETGTAFFVWESCFACRVNAEEDAFISVCYYVVRFQFSAYNRIEMQLRGSCRE